MTSTTAPTTAAPTTTLARTSGANNEASGLRVVVVGLLGIAFAIGVLTYLYWRHTKPEEAFYPYGDLLESRAAIDDSTERGNRSDEGGEPRTQQLAAMADPGGEAVLDGEPLRIITREELERAQAGPTFARDAELDTRDESGG